MTYNLENLFDTSHDVGKHDYSYLPLEFKRSSIEVQRYCETITNDWYRQTCLNLDWSELVLDRKIANMAKVILSAKAPYGPEVLVFQEIENKKALQLLVSRGLKAAGYRYISLIEGPDSRGIDTAIVSKFPIISEKAHKVELDGVAKDTRLILQADLKVGDKVVSVFSNHWPSQSNPSEARFIAAETLLKASQKSQADLVIAAGDFNTVKRDSPHGINQVIRPYFHVANDEAADSGVDVFEGSHWYRGEWSFLDRIFVLKSSEGKGVKPLYETFKVHMLDWMLKQIVYTDFDTGVSGTYIVPADFDAETMEGYSDHLPLTMEFSY